MEWWADEEIGLAVMFSVGTVDLLSTLDESAVKADVAAVEAAMVSAEVRAAFWQRYFSFDLGGRGGGIRLMLLLVEEEDTDSLLSALTAVTALVPPLLLPSRLPCCRGGCCLKLKEEDEKVRHTFIYTSDCT